MSDPGHDESDKSYEPTPEKIRKAREKGDVPRSQDLSVAASYLGLLIAALALGTGSISHFGSGLMAYLSQPDHFGQLFTLGNPSAPFGHLLLGTLSALWMWFVIPAVIVVLAILAQRSFVVTPSKLAPKMSRISVFSNAKNKFGRAGLFEFAKSAAKLLLYTICVGVYLTARSNMLVGTIYTSSGVAAAQLGRLFVEFMLIVLFIAGTLGVIDALWQQAEFRRKNMMSRKEVMDEAKEAEGDPYLNATRRRKGEEIALNQMLANVPDADVVVVNPTHYAVALKWSRKPGAAPVCVAKGVDEVALTIRRMAAEANVPIHEDPPTARALYGTVHLDEEIPETLYKAVAVAIRFADNMRKKAKSRV